MKKKFVAALAAICLFAPTVAHADELARQANVNLILNIADMVTTREAIRAGSHEANPIARPFTHSDGAAIGYAIAANLLARIIFRRMPKAFLVLDAGEAYLTIHNQINTIRFRAFDKANGL